MSQKGDFKPSVLRLHSALVFYTVLWIRHWGSKRDSAESPFHLAKQAYMPAICASADRKQKFLKLLPEKGGGASQLRGDELQGTLQVTSGCIEVYMAHM